MTTIRVNQDHIRRGVRCDPCKCPISLAVQEHTPLTPVVYGIDIVLGARSVRLPDAAARFVYDYDLGRPVTPFEFELAL